MWRRWRSEVLKQIFLEQLETPVQVRRFRPNLREAVVSNFAFRRSDKLLIHIDEAMSWECVRNLKLIREAFLVVRNFARQSVPDELVGMVREPGRSSFGNRGGRITLRKLTPLFRPLPTCACELHAIQSSQQSHPTQPPSPPTHRR